MKGSAKRGILISMIAVFALIYGIASLAYPEIGEKILYGKHPPGKDSEVLQYTDIVLTENYDCMESASLKAKGDLPKFVKEFNDCHN